MITDDGSRTLIDACGETFHSGCGALSECLVVYLVNSGTLGRLERRLSSCVLEFGLGTCTSLLVTAAAANYFHTSVTYIGLEANVLPMVVLEQLQLPDTDFLPAELVAEFPFLTQLKDSHAQLLGVWKQVVNAALHVEAPVTRIATRVGKFVQLHVLIGDATRFQQSWLTPILGEGASCDAVYFDPFSPQTAPMFWRRELLIEATQVLRAGGSLTSYCVKADVRRLLSDLGLHVSKTAGPIGGKREVLIATKPE